MVIRILVLYIFSSVFLNNVSNAQLFDETVNTFIFQPIASQTINVLTSDGHTTPHTTAVIEVSDVLSKGSFYVGNLKVQLQAKAPTWNYRYKEVGSVPKAICTQVIKVCSVVDTGTFDSGVAGATTDTTLSALQAQADASSSVRRRLLATTTTTSTPSLYTRSIPSRPAYSNPSSKEARALINTVDFDQWFTDVTDATNYNLADQEQNTQAIAQLQKQALLQGNITDLIRQAVQAATSNLTSQLNSAAKDVESNFKSFQTQLSNDFNVSTRLIAALAVNMMNLTTALSSQTLHIEEQFILQSATIGDINAALFFELTQTSLKRAVSAAYFKVIETLPNVFFPLVTDDGTPPVANGELLASDTRILLDTFYVMYDEEPYLGAGPKRIAVKEINWFLGTDAQLLSANPSTSLRDVFQSFGSSGCMRPYYDTTKPWTSPNGALARDNLLSNSTIVCTGWVEIIQTRCVSKDPLYNWADPAANSKHSLDATNCINSNIERTYIVLKSLEEFKTYMNKYVCDSSNDLKIRSGVYFVGIQSINRSKMVQQLSPDNMSNSCSADTLLQISNKSTVMGYMFSVVYSYSFSLIYNRLLALEQKKYGRLPSGLRYETLPFDAVPVVGNLTNTGAYTPRMCHRVTVNLAHIETLPVYAVYPDPTSLVSKRITRRISKVDASVVLDTTDGINLDEPVVFTDNILLVDNAQHLLPQSSLVVGSLSNPLYWYDIPSRLMSVVSSIYARKNTATYYLMPPGTSATWKLPRFQAEYNGLYDAIDAAVGPNLFAVPVAFDNLGYPVCTVGSSLLDSSTMNGATYNNSRTCAGRNTWDSNTALTATITSVCSPSYFGAFQPVKIFNRLVDLKKATFTNAPWADGTLGFALHFTMEGLSSSTPVGLKLSGPTQISVDVEYAFNRISVNVITNSVSTSIQTSFGSLFNGKRHSVLIIFSGAVFVDRVGIVIDGWLDVWQALNARIPDRAGGTSQWDPPSTSIPGVEAMYGLTWPIGVASEVYAAYLAEALRVCSFAVSENHCSPSISNDALDFASPTLSISGPDKQCPVGAVSIFRSQLLDNAVQGITQTRTNILTSNTFTVSWWQHISDSWMILNGGSTEQNVNIELYPLFSFVSGTSPNVFNCRASINKQHRLVVTVFKGTFQFQLITTKYIVTPVLSAVKVALRLEDSVLRLFVNQVEEAQIACDGFVGTNTGFTLDQINKQGVVSLIRVYSYALTNSALKFDMYCDAADSTSYVNPVGYCRKMKGATAAASTYCRTPAMCNGNCETFAAYSSAASSFANVGINQCDDGFLAPDCLHPCSHPDADTGVCLTNDINDPSSYGSTHTLVPSGTWCDVLKNYQVSVAPKRAGSSDQAMTMSPRKYTMQTSIVIPSGEIIATADSSGVCPVVQSVGVGNSANLMISNPGATKMSVRVKWTTTLDCRQQLQEDRTIDGYLSVFLTVPTCGNVTADVSTGSFVRNNDLIELQFAACRHIEFQSLASFIDSTSSDQTNSIYNTAVTVSDMALQRSLSVSTALTSATLVMLHSFGIDIKVFQDVFTSSQQVYIDTFNAKNANRTILIPGFNFTDPCASDSICADLFGKAINMSKNAVITLIDTHGRTPVYVTTADVAATITDLLKEVFKSGDYFFAFFAMLILPYSMLRVTETVFVWCVNPYYLKVKKFVKLLFQIYSDNGKSMQPTQKKEETEQLVKKTSGMAKIEP